MPYVYKTTSTNSCDANTDSEIWDDFKSGCEKAFSHIFHSHYQFLYNYGIKLSTDKDLIKDSIQELFIILWESRSRLGETQSIKFYLLKSFRRHLIRALQMHSKDKEIKNLSENYKFQIVFSPEKDLIAEQSFLEQQHHLLAALNSLSPRQKEIVYLKFYNNLSYQEIAEVTSLNYQSVRNYVHQAILALRKKTSLLAAVSMYSLICFLLNLY